jgi:hypothetical protein
MEGGKEGGRGRDDGGRREGGKGKKRGRGKEGAEGVEEVKRGKAE